MESLKVSSNTKPKELAGAIAGELRRSGKVEALAVGAGAVCQTVKGIAAARGYLITSGQDLRCIPSFFTTTNKGIEWTGIRFVVETLAA